MSGDPENLIEFRCSNCAKRLKAKAKHAGKKLQCPNCSTELRIPSSSGSANQNSVGATSPKVTGTGAKEDSSKANNAPEIGSSTNNISLESLALDALDSSAPKKESSNKPLTNSFDVDDLQLESMAISDLADRHRDSEEIRSEKENKRRLQLAAEERRRQERNPKSEEVAPLSRQSIDTVATQSAQDDYSLLPEIAPTNSQARNNLASMLDNELLPKLAPEPNSPAAVNNKPANNATSRPTNTKSPSSNPSNSKPTNSIPTNSKPPSAKPPSAGPTIEPPKDDFGDLDALVPELEPPKTNTNSLAFFDDVVEDRYRVACPICGTAQYVGIEAKGTQTQCSDCFSKYPVPGPPANWKPSKVAKRHDQFNTNSPLSSDQDTRAVDKQRKQLTNDLLERAEHDIEKETSDEDRYGVADFDTNNFLQRTFGFLKDPVALGFIFGYSLVFALVFALIQYGISNVDNAEFGRGAALFCIISGPLLGLLFGLPMISAALAQLEAVANHQLKVVDWPGFNMFDNIGDLMCVAISIGMSAIPGFLVGWTLGGDSAGSGRIILACVLFSVLLLFPIFLLSILDSGNLFGLITKDVARSMKEVSEAWASYYFKTAIFFALTMVAWFMLLGAGKSSILAAIAGASFPLLVFFLFQQVGGLADLIGEHLSFSFSAGDESDDDKIEDLEDSI